MKQERISYADIMSLGFKEEKCEDEVYFNEYGFEYAIITKELTDTIYLDWEKDSQLCKMIRINNTDDYSIKAEMPIKDWNHLLEMIEFFTQDQSVDCF